MLVSLAIADDIGAVVVIAVFYNSGLDWGMLLLAGSGLAALYAFRRFGARSILVYVMFGACVWLGFYKSGVNPAIAGAILGLMTPTASWVSRDSLRLALTDLAGSMKEDGRGDLGTEDLRLLAFAAREATSPLDRLETTLHPWVGFVIMPLFALANAGVAVNVAALGDPIAVGVGLGLLLGKPAGVLLFSWLAVRMGIARLPYGVTWGMMAGAGALAGI